MLWLQTFPTLKRKSVFPLPFPPLFLLPLLLMLFPLLLLLLPPPSFSPLHSLHLSLCPLPSNPLQFGLEDSLPLIIPSAPPPTFTQSMWLVLLLCSIQLPLRILLGDLFPLQDCLKYLL